MWKLPFNQKPSKNGNGQRINLKEKWEEDYWSNRLHTTPSNLFSAIKKVGNRLSDVKKELEK